MLGASLSYVSYTDSTLRYVSMPGHAYVSRRGSENSKGIAWTHSFIRSSYSLDVPAL